MIKQKVVIFVERKSELQFVSLLIEDLKRKSNIVLVSLDSKLKDIQVEGIVTKVFYSKLLLQLYFMSLKADVLLSTAPYLGFTFFKKSLVSKPKYIHIVHSLKSLHHSYGAEAFLEFDIIVIASSNQFEELRLIEKKEGHPNKQVWMYGHEPIEKLQTLNVGYNKEIQYILIAPSWNGPLSNHEVLMELFKEVGKKRRVVFRPHEILWKKLPKRFKDTLEGLVFVSLCLNNSDVDSIIESDLLISDVSGFALEYGMATNKPILFYEDKENSYFKKYKYDLVPSEIALRTYFGKVFSFDDIKRLESLFNELECERNGVHDFLYCSNLHRKEIIEKITQIS